jgi:enterochelin esterase-like enzyme
MKKLRKIMLVCMVTSFFMVIIANAQEAPAAGGRFGMGAAPAGAAGRGAMERGMMGMGGRGGASSPAISSDNKVTFRLSAPKAASVTVRGDFGDAAQMTKDEQGVWSVTVGPLQPEVYSYTFDVDGVTVLDPSNFQLSRDTTRNQNLLIVPGEGSDLYIVKDVPHGSVSQVWYDSPSLKMKRRMVVYTPPGYETSSEKYPVLYVLHGGGGDEEQWLRMARVPQIFDNLIAAGKAKPMIVVMPNGNANQAAATEAAPASTGPRRGGAGTPDARGAAGAMGAAGNRGAAGGATGGYSEDTLSVIAEDYVKSVGAFIDKYYRVRPGPENRAITGLSMGGGHAFYTGMKNMDYYGWVGEFSTSMFGGLQNTGFNYDLDSAIGGVFKDPANIKKKLKLLYLSCGREDPRLTATKEMTEALRKRGIEVVYTDWPGAHEWKVWRCALADMAKKLFQ